MAQESKSGHRLKTRLTEKLGCRYPIISAGMGGPSRSELAAAVSEAGGFGLLGMVREPPALIEKEIAAVRARTDRPFGVNVIPASTDPKLLDEQLEVCFAAKVPAMCFFWSVMPGVVAPAREADCLVLYQVGSVADAIEAERAGADIVIVQGVEAGGHVRGKLPLSVLLPEVAAAIKLPIAASGGIVTGADMIAAMAVGADGVHCGTVFLPTPESFAHDFHKRRILDAKSGDTVHTDLFALNWPPNSPVRVLRNSLTEAVGHKLWGHHPDKLPREPIGEDAGQPILKFSTHSPLRTTTGDLEKMPPFAGEGAGRVNKARSAAQVIADMMAEAEASLDRLEAMRA
jgi:nitronate monooxygenase